MEQNDWAQEVSVGESSESSGRVKQQRSSISHRPAPQRICLGVLAYGRGPLGIDVSGVSGVEASGILGGEVSGGEASGIEPLGGDALGGLRGAGGETALRPARGIELEPLGESSMITRPPHEAKAASDISTKLVPSNRRADTRPLANAPEPIR